MKKICFVLCLTFVSCSLGMSTTSRPKSKFESIIDSANPLLETQKFLDSNPNSSELNDFIANVIISAMSLYNNQSPLFLMMRDEPVEIGYKDKLKSLLIDIFYVLIINGVDFRNTFNSVVNFPWTLDERVRLAVNSLFGISRDIDKIIESNAKLSSGGVEEEMDMVLYGRMGFKFFFEFPPSNYFSRRILALRSDGILDIINKSSLRSLQFIYVLNYVFRQYVDADKSNISPGLQNLVDALTQRLATEYALTLGLSDYLPFDISLPLFLSNNLFSNYVLAKLKETNFYTIFDAKLAKVMQSLSYQKNIKKGSICNV